MRKIGLHIHSLTHSVYQAVTKLQPPGVIMINTKAEEIRNIRAVAGPKDKCYIGVRLFEDGVPFWERDPIDWTNRIAAMCGDALHLVNGAVVYNEPMPQGHDNHDHFPLFDEWQARAITHLQSLYGLEALAFSFGSGQFTGAPDRVRLDEAFPLSCEVCTTVASHDYDWPNIWRSEGLRAFRWLQWLDDIEQAGFGRKQVIVSEWGLTQATYGGPDVGWRSGVDLWDYIEQMTGYNAKFCQIPEGKFFAPFDWGGSGAFGYDTFEHAPEGDDSVVQRIWSIDFEVPEKPEEPEEPDGGDEVTEVKVFDFEQGLDDPSPRDLDYLRSIFGDVKILNPPGLKPGDIFWKVAWLNCKVGGTACIIVCTDQEESPVEGARTIFYWPDAETLSDQGLQIVDHIWTDRGAVGPTDVDGGAGPSFGTGAYYDPSQGEVGPHWVWIYDETTRSQAVINVGMLTWHDEVQGNHLHFDIGFQLAVYEETPTPPVPPEAGIAAEIRGMGQRLLQIADALEVTDQKAADLLTLAREVDQEL